jgi:LysR family hydrogen peroxide-inducible transcriptional activator
MTLTQLEYALAVNKFRHFGKAAKACHVTQPTLSMQLQKLEDTLGVILFDRSKSPILPTLDGEAVLAQALVVLRESKKIMAIIDSNEQELAGEFRLSVIPTLSPYVLPLFVQDFSKRYPNVKLIIEENKTEDIISLLGSDEIDAGLLVTPLHDDSLIERALFYEPFSIFASPDHKLLKKNKVKDTDLLGEDLWLLNEGHCFRDQVLNICSLERSTSEGNLQFESGNLETLKNMVLRGKGYTLLPKLASSNLSTAQKKLVREFSKPVPTREISLVYSRTFLKERIIDALEQVILSSIPKDLKSLKTADLEIVEIF